MNLAALWAHERARVCATQQHTLSSHADADDRRTLKRQSSNSSLAVAPAGSAVANASGNASSTVKKKVSMVVRRDSVYKKLVEESALPLALALTEPVLGIDAVRSLADARNEFAMEYADRAPRRFVLQQPTQPTHATDATALAAGTGTDGVGNTVPNEAPAGSSTKPGKRKPSALKPVTNGAVVPKVTALVAAATSGFPRRNPRKRGNGNSLELAPHAFKPYVGDMFGTRGDYVEGMLYMSRMKRSHQLTFGHDGTASDFAPAGRNALKDAVADAFSAAVAAAAVGNLNVTAGDSSSSTNASAKSMGAGSSLAHGNGSAAAMLSEISPEEILQLRQRQRCSLTLSNWSSNPENARLMVQENVVEALILLCKASDGDRVTKLHCVTTFMNLSHVDELRSELVQQGAVKTLVEIANDSDDDKTLRTACAVTLCNLCCCLEGEEEILVEDGAVGALSLLINEHPKTAAICLGALYNLTCVKEPYHKIESVLKVFLTLASSTSSPSSAANVERDELIAKALCNLSNFKRVRLRLLEEGIVSAISNVIHARHSHIQQLLAYVVLNLSAMRACRSELVAKGCLGALSALTSATSAHDGEAKCLIALSLWNLSKEPGNRLRMVFEGFLPLVSELCRGGGTSSDKHAEAVRAVCARTLYNVSCSDETRLKLVERDAVSILSSLSQRCVGDDGKKMCTLSLCNLLSVQQAASDIVAAGAITSLIELSMVTVPPQTLETRHLFSKALYGLCEMAATRAAVVQAGIIPAIIQLSSIVLPASRSGAAGVRQAGLLSEIRARCTAALACLAGDDALAASVCTPDVARSVVQILVHERFNIAIERVCCACLSLLCRDEQCSQVVADEGAIEAVLSTCLETQDVETKASCCHVLASISCHRSCCMALVNMGALPVLATLAKSGTSKGSGAMVQRCCAITLANLSAEREIRDILVKSSIVPLLSLLSNSYSEDSQRDCARVLCNLSSVEGYEASLVQEGALGVLMMISMVRALQPATKETCLRAFANLLTPATVHSMIYEGVVKVLPVFVGLTATTHANGATSDEPFASSVVHAVSVIFGKLMLYEEGRHALRTENTALRALVSLRPYREDEDEERLYESLLTGVVYHDELRERSVDVGLLDAVHQLAMHCLTRGRSVAQIALMLFTLAKHEATRSAAASPSSLSTLVALLVSDTPAIRREKESVLYSVSTLCHLAWHDATRANVNPNDITVPLTRLIRLAVEGGEASPSEPAIATCLLTLCCLSDRHDHLAAMLQEGIVSHLLGLMKVDSLDTRTLLPLVCIVFRQLSNAPAFATSLAKSPAQSAAAIKLFCLLARRAAAEEDSAAALDCSDILCSITFLPPPTTSSTSTSPSRPPPFVRRQSQPQLALRGSMAVASSVPPAALISAAVLETISVLVSGESHLLAESRWRCMASLYAFSCIADHRHTLVRLGCTRLLVHEAARAVTSASASAVELATLRCIAGALCNLTIVSGANANANAQTMIEEDAVPALIQLAKRENEEIREYCTLALSNLSSQSPKVESGAVSALLSLSLRPGSSASGTLNSQVGVARPPPVVNARHKDISKLPDYCLQLVSQDDVLHQKHEAAQGQASTPPPPSVPVLSPDLSMVGGLGRSAASSQNETAPDGPEAHANRDEAMLRRRKSSSIGDVMGISPVTTPASGSSSSRGENGADGDLRGWQTLSFPKIDPVESRALNMGMEDAVDPANNEESSVGPTDDTSSTSARSGEDESAHADDRSDAGDARSERDDSSVHKPKPKAGASAVSLSPLARVVIRKSHTSNAINKLKNLRTHHSGNRGGGSSSSSSSSLPLATVDEAHEAHALVQSSSSRRLPVAHVSVSKAPSLQQMGTSKSISLVHHVDATTATEHQRPTAGPAIVPAVNAVKDSGATDAVSSVATAAAAALLYSAGPVRDTTSKSTTEPKTKHAKPIKAKAKDKMTKRHNRSALDEGPSSPVHSAVAPVVATIEDVQAQVKLLGLWN